MTDNKISKYHNIYTGKQSTYQCSKNTVTRGFTLLMRLVMKNISHSEIETYLKDNIGEINEKNDSGWSVLLLACRNSTKCSNEIVHLLLENGADVDSQNYINYTALMAACKNSTKDSNNKTVAMLLEFGANINLQNLKGRSALMIACDCINAGSSIETIKILLKHNANLNLQDVMGQTALMIICDNLIKLAEKRYSDNHKFVQNNIEVVNLLLNHKININLKNNKNESVIVMAAQISNIKYRKNTIGLINDYNVKKMDKLEKKLLYYELNVKPQPNIVSLDQIFI